MCSTSYDKFLQLPIVINSRLKMVKMQQTIGLVKMIMETEQVDFQSATKGSEKNGLTMQKFELRLRECKFCGRIPIITPTRKSV